VGEAPDAGLWQQRISTPLVARSFETTEFVVVVLYLKIELPHRIKRCFVDKTIYFIRNHMSNSQLVFTVDFILGEVSKID
jgi:hypothetical protein